MEELNELLKLASVVWIVGGVWKIFHHRQLERHQKARRCRC